MIVEGGVEFMGGEVMRCWWNIDEMLDMFYVEILEITEGQLW